MKIIKNIQIEGRHQKPILADLFFKENALPKKVIVFCHGYKGYKDWGAWNLMAARLADLGFFFLKMNFSHNGGTPDQPIDFPDLEAFGRNNYLIELDDLDSVLGWIGSYGPIQKEIDKENISLMGHSRGGAIVVLKASHDPRVSKVVSLAGVSDFGSRFPKGDILDQWKKDGVAYITNARTQQQMPHYYQFYTTFKENEAYLNIREAVQNLKIPYLIIHGDQDETVPLQEARNLKSWNDNNRLEVIEKANHTFGATQPWDAPGMPEPLIRALEVIVPFLKD
jgi:pimeloyl-ACP methyl ester carboxylesterase